MKIAFKNQYLWNKINSHIENEIESQVWTKTPNNLLYEWSFPANVTEDLYLTPIDAPFLKFKAFSFVSGETYLV